MWLAETEAGFVVRPGGDRQDERALAIIRKRGRVEGRQREQQSAGNSLREVFIRFANIHNPHFTGLNQAGQFHRIQGHHCRGAAIHRVLPLSVDRPAAPATGRQKSLCKSFARAAASGPARR